MANDKLKINKIEMKEDGSYHIQLENSEKNIINNYPEQMRILKTPEGRWAVEMMSSETYSNHGGASSVSSILILNNDADKDKFIQSLIDIKAASDGASFPLSPKDKKLASVLKDFVAEEIGNSPLLDSNSLHLQSKYNKLFKEIENILVDSTLENENQIEDLLNSKKFKNTFDAALEIQKGLVKFTKEHQADIDDLGLTIIQGSNEYEKATHAQASEAYYKFLAKKAAEKVLSESNERK
jgi:hypothetical protein